MIPWKVATLQKFDSIVKQSDSENSKKILQRLKRNESFSKEDKKPQIGNKVIKFWGQFAEQKFDSRFVSDISRNLTTADDQWV